MGKGSDYEKLIHLQRLALDTIEEAMIGVGEEEAMQMAVKLKAIERLESMLKRSGVMIAEGKEDASRTFLRAIEHRERAINAARSRNDLITHEIDAAAAAEMVNHGRAH